MLSAWIAALLLAANEYHTHASLLATEKGYYLFFATLSVWCFQRFMAEERSQWMYAAAAAAGVSFLCKESAALLLPVFFITLLATRHRVWLARRAPYVALLVFGAVVSPDIWWNVANQDATSGANYGRHLSGVSSLGITYQPFILYGREAVAFVLAKLGRPLYDNAREYAAGNFLLSLIIGGAVLSAVWNVKRRREPHVTLFLVLFAFILLFFTFIGARSTPGLDPFVFFWGDLSLIGGVVLGGLWAGRLGGWQRAIAACVLVAALAVAARREFGDLLGGRTVAVRAEPETIESAPDTFRDVALSFNFCMLCDQQPRVELVAVRARRFGRDVPPNEAANLISDAVIGTDDRLVRLDASADPPPGVRAYQVEYRIIQRGGKTAIAQTRITVPAELPARLRKREW
jgi:4-amino-4-deoxy-L-arabinose transferase-like glycosyltransferase